MSLISFIRRMDSRLKTLTPSTVDSNWNISVAPSDSFSLGKMAAPATLPMDRSRSLSAASAASVRLVISSSSMTHSCDAMRCARGLAKSGNETSGRARASRRRGGFRASSRNGKGISRKGMCRIKERGALGTRGGRAPTLSFSVSNLASPKAPTKTAMTRTVKNTDKKPVQGLRSQCLQ